MPTISRATIMMYEFYLQQAAPLRQGRAGLSRRRYDAAGCFITLPRLRRMEYPYLRRLFSLADFYAHEVWR